MADIQLPGKSLIQAFQSGGEISMAAAAAPYNAAQQVGETIQGLGEKGMAVIVQHQRVDNLRQANELELKANDLYSQFQQETFNDPDPKTVPERWMKRLEDFKKQNLPESLAPEQQAMIGERFAQFASTSTANIAKSAFSENIRQSKISSGNIIEQSLKMGTPSRAFGEIDSMEAARIVSKPEAEQLRMSVQEKFEIQFVEQAAAVDPLGVISELDDKSDDGTWRNYSNLDPNQRARLKEVAKANYRQVLGDVVEAAQNGMADGSISKPEQLEKMAGGIVSPRVMEKMKSELAERATEEYKLKVSQPSYQNEVVGKVSAMLSNYSAESEGFDEKFVEMDSMIRTLPPGAVKEELTRQINSARSGQVQEVKTVVDQARKTLRDDFSRGTFGQVRKDQSAGSAIDAGLLRDRDKLKAAGFNDESLEYITGKNKDGDFTEEGKKLADTERRKRFVKKYPQRISKKTAGDSFVQAAFDTIRRGDSSVSWIDEDSQKRAEQTYGKVLTDLEDWAATNPEDAKNPIKLGDKIHELTKPYGARNASSVLLPPLPVFDEGVSGESTLLPPPPINR